MSNAVTFYLYYIRNREYTESDPFDNIIKPYGRIFVMHITIIAGAAIFFTTNYKGLGIIAVWLALKIIFDLRGQFPGAPKKTGHSKLRSLFS